MKFLVVLSFELDDSERLVDVVKQINPTYLPGFTGRTRLAMDPIATQVETWLDEED